VSRSSLAFQQRVTDLSNYLGRQANPANGLIAGQTQVYQLLGQQASLWAFVDVFRYMSLICFFSVLLVWLFRKVSPGKKPPAGAH
jgi:MFS transporter, DHA2 family, multidrug resistance protein